MTKKELEITTRLGPKGQIVLRKEVRKALGVKPGSLVEQKVVGRKVILQAFDWNAEMKALDRLAERVSKKWPKGVTSVQATREDRE